MDEAKLDQLSWLKKGILLLFAAFLFWQMVWPAREISSAKDVALFFLAFCLFLFLRATRLPFWVQIPLKLLIILFVLNRIFNPHIPMLTEHWFVDIWVQMWKELQGFRVEWIFIGPYYIVRSFSFLLIVWYLSSFMVRSFFSKKRIYLPFLVAFLYLILVNLITDYDVGSAIVWVTIDAILCFSWVKWQDLLLRLPFLDAAPRGWSRWTLLLLIVLIGLGFLLPAVPTAPPDPNGFIATVRDWFKGTGGGDVRETGYSQNDEHLGGSLRKDQTVVLRAEVDELFYWRGESKDYYTGDGWVNSFVNDEVPAAGGLTERDDGTLDIVQQDSFFNLYRNMDLQTNHVIVRWNPPWFSTLLVPGQLEKIQRFNGRVPADVPFTLLTQMGFSTSTVRTSWGGMQVNSAQMVTEIPLLDPVALRQVHASTDDEKMIITTNTQLPANLPSRIHQLALQITSSAHTPYDQAVAIESYLKSGSYQYDTTLASVPAKGEDFVDNFLFNTKRGYCDHFSTSMVVLLRTLHVPARWVKGFTPGDVTYNSQKQRYEVIVRNKHAHSWVEVYITGVGWIPFEPTPSFTNPALLETSTIGGTTDHPGTGGGGSSTGTHGHSRQIEQEVSDANADGNITNSLGTDLLLFFASIGINLFWLKDVNWTIAGVFVGLLLFTGILWLLRRRIEWWWLYRQTRLLNSPTADRNQISKLYEACLRWLERKSGKRKPDQTLREYWDSGKTGMNPPSTEAITITTLYEEIRYGEDQTGYNTQSEQETYTPPQTFGIIWRKLLKQLRN